MALPRAAEGLAFATIPRLASPERVSPDGDGLLWPGTGSAHACETIKGSFAGKLASAPPARLTKSVCGRGEVADEFLSKDW